jgi:hypothetical protein
LDLLKNGAKIKNCFQNSFEIGTVPFKIVWNGFITNSRYGTEIVSVVWQTNREQNLKFSGSIL